MELTDITFVPHNDIQPEDMAIAQEHNNLIKNNKYSDAVSYLDNENFSKSFRASLFNAIQEKLKALEIYLLNKTAEPEEYYSFTEPSEEEMVGKTFWIQPY